MEITRRHFLTNKSTSYADKCTLMIILQVLHKMGIHNVIYLI